MLPKKVKFIEITYVDDLFEAKNEDVRRQLGVSAKVVRKEYQEDEDWQMLANLYIQRVPTIFRVIEFIEIGYYE